MVGVPPKVKICGITNLHDAELAVELGAWALGMIFFQDSPRRCARAEAERIVATLRRKVELCGVFVNAPLEQVVAFTEDLGLTMLQFNGEEGPSFCAEATYATSSASMSTSICSTRARKTRASETCAAARGRRSTGRSCALAARRSR